MLPSFLLAVISARCCATRDPGPLLLHSMYRTVFSLKKELTFFDEYSIVFHSKIKMSFRHIRRQGTIARTIRRRISVSTALSGKRTKAFAFSCPISRHRNKYPKNDG